MADAFDSAAQELENQRRAAVAAIASGGTAGAQALAQANQQIASLRSAALQQALSDAAQRGAPADAQAVFRGIISRPYDQLSAGVTSSAASRAADFAGRQGSVDAYFRQMIGALPAARVNLDQQMAPSQSKSQKGLSDSALRTRLTGAGELLREQAVGEARQGRRTWQKKINAAKERLPAIKQELRRWRRNKPIAGNAADLVRDKNDLERQIVQARRKRAPYSATLSNIGSVEEYARKAGIDTGLDPATVYGLIKVPKLSSSRVLSAPRAATQIGLKPKGLRRIVNATDMSGNSTWAPMVKSAEEAIKSGESFEAFAENLRTYAPRGTRRAQALVLAMYRPAFR